MKVMINNKLNYLKNFQGMFPKINNSRGLCKGKKDSKTKMKVLLLHQVVQ